MSEQNERLYYLLERYSANACSHEELAEFSRLVNSAEDTAMLSALDSLFEQIAPGYQVEGVDLDEMFNAIVRTKPVIKRNIFYRLRFVAAAAAVLGIAACTWVLLQRNDKTSITAAKYKNDVAPGKYGAILKLGDNTTIVLDSTGNGQLAQQGTSKVIKLDSGQLAYQNNTTTASKAIEYNTLITPKGRQFQVVLPDGSHVWLNAGSSLRYPTAFPGATREVELTGEGYFEVAKNKEQPFHVKMRDVDVIVLGTHFNIMAYPDEEDVEATLLEGAVKVSKGASNKVIMPGQQAVLPNTGSQINIRDADTDKVMAWRQGFFQFDQTDLTTILRQLSRWYDVDVSYEGQVPNRKFFGRINRNLTLSGVLQILEANNIHFRIEGNKLIVTP